MSLLIFLGLLLHKTSHGHVLPNIHRYNGTEAFEIREDTGSPVRILVPKAENNLTLREIIYYHMIERPYDNQKESKGGEVSEEDKFASDEMRRPFTNSHGFQFLDSYDTSKDQNPLPETDSNEDLALSSDEIDEFLTSIFGPKDHNFSSYEDDNFKTSSEIKPEGTKIHEQPEKNDGTKIPEEREKSEVNKIPEDYKKDEKTKITEETENNQILTVTQGTQTEPITLAPAEKKRISRKELFDQQKHRYEIKAARHKRDITQADIPPPPTLPPPFDYKSYLTVDIRKKMLERSTAETFKGDGNTLMNIISSKLSRMFGVDEPRSNKDSEGELQKYHGPTPRTYGVNLKNGEGYVWNGLWSNPPLKYRVGENAPENEDSQTSNPSDSSEEIISKLADLFTEIENLTNNDENDDNVADNNDNDDDTSNNDNDSSVGNDEENNESSADVNSYDDDGVNIPDDEETSSNDNKNDKSKQNYKEDEIKSKIPKQVNNDEVLEDGGSYKPISDDENYKPSGEDGSYRHSEYESDSNDKPLDSKEVLPSEDPQANYDIEFLKPKNNNAHVKYMHDSSEGKQSESKDSRNHQKPNKDKSIIPKEESSNEKKKGDRKKKDPKKGFFKGQFTLDKYDTSNNDDFDHLEEKYRVKDKIEGKRIDTLVEIMKDEQFWKWLAEWTSTYMEVLTKYIKKIAQEEIQYQMKEWENNHHQNVTPNREESEPEPSKNDEKKPATEEEPNENNKMPEDIKDKQKHEKLKPSRDSEEDEDAIIISGKIFPLTHNSDLDEIDEVTQYLKGRKNKDGNKKPNVTQNKEKKDHNKERNKDNKDKDNIPAPASKETIEEANKTAKVESAVIYGNSVNSDSVTNIFLFYPNGELKQTQHSVPHKNHIKPNKEEAESNKIKDSTPKIPGKDKLNSTLTEEKSTTPKTIEEWIKPEADNKVTEAPKTEEKVTSTESPTKDEIKKDKPELSSENRAKPETATETSTKTPDTKPRETNKQEIGENKDSANTKTQVEKKADESKKNSDSEKIESKTENTSEKKNDTANSSTVKPDDAKADSVSKNDKSDSKNEADFKKDESDSTKETDSKKDETESKKDDDTKKDVSDSKKDDSDSKDNDSESKKNNDSKKEIEEEHTDASKDEKKDSRR